MTTLLQQYKAIKAKYPDAVVLFRVGDFYEAYNEDAKIVALYHGNMLTFSEPKEEVAETASIPHYTLDYALSKLVKAGFRVAVCDPLEEPIGEAAKRSVTDFTGPHRA